MVELDLVEVELMRQRLKMLDRSKVEVVIMRRKKVGT